MEFWRKAPVETSCVFVFVDENFDKKKKKLIKPHSGSPEVVVGVLKTGPNASFFVDDRRLWRNRTTQSTT
jgi:hypothetical protein